jgi:hypothetical protein
VARCPICLRCFCRECITEHEDRVICAGCLRKIVVGEAARSGAAGRVLRSLLPVAGLLLAWLTFYVLGRTLLLIPVSVHDGTVWEQK